jgi:very-short-patch-repair endonuclease
MRSAMTEAELKLWNELRAHRLMGLSLPASNASWWLHCRFCLPEHKLIVEVDGSQHADERAVRPGKMRTYLQQQGGRSSASGTMMCSMTSTMCAPISCD